NELRRIIRPGGYLVFTTQGRRMLDVSKATITPANRERFEAGEPFELEPEAAGANQCLFFHPEVYVREKLSAGFEVVDFIPEGATGSPFQDLYLLKKV
ncbi:MAG TPA: class I SAM-dependent methyltransferase, partial [Planctomycetota bacterium]|nr:class I SAM-dependent methyltransferase [Planctomycetota bacterium]